MIENAAQAHEQATRTSARDPNTFKTLLARVLQRIDEAAHHGDLFIDDVLTTEHISHAMLVRLMDELRSRDFQVKLWNKDTNDLEVSWDQYDQLTEIEYPQDDTE